MFGRCEKRTSVKSHLEAQILACPKCKESVEVSDAKLVCLVCGPVGRITLGFYDFLSDKNTLPLAAGGSFDLEADAEKAALLLASGEDLSFEELLGLSIGYEETKRGAEGRYIRHYWKACREVGFNHGSALLSKVNGFLAYKGRSELASGIAVEAGGGQGYFLPDFSSYFSHLCFVDCSLENLVLARRVAKDHSIQNVTYVRGDVTELPLKGRSCEFVHSNGVIEHVAVPQAAVDESLRVISKNGTFVCLSPNRYPLTPEAHFRLPLYGIFPSRVRLWLIKRTRGASDEAGTDLLSLRQLKKHFRSARVDPDIFFLPPRLPYTARSSPVRRLVLFALNFPATAGIAHFLLNVFLLPVAPFHIALYGPDRSSDVARIDLDENSEAVDQA
jgi:SAM-dependent methyltransferase